MQRRSDAASPSVSSTSNIVLGSIVHELALIRAFAGDPVAIDAVDVWPDGVWPPSVVDRWPARRDDARFAIRWHFLPDYPAYREEVRVVTEQASIELEFPSPYLSTPRPTCGSPSWPATARRDTRFRSVAEAFEEELLAFHRLVVDGTAPKAGVVEGRRGHRDVAADHRPTRGQTGLPVEIEAPA